MAFARQFTRKVPRRVRQAGDKQNKVEALIKINILQQREKRSWKVKD